MRYKEDLPPPRGHTEQLPCADCGGVHLGLCESTMDRMAKEAAVKTALATQIGGGHYKDMKIQPVEFIHANGIGYFEGCVIKYVSRWRKKNGVEDLKKARHFLDLLIELESEKGASNA